MESTVIKPLRGPNRVRLRPFVMFGSDGAEGVLNATKMLLNIFTNEARIGHCSGIDLKIYKDNSISIHSLDRGIIIDDTIIDGKPAWHDVFCEIFPAPREPVSEITYPLEQQNGSLYATDEKSSSDKIIDDHGFSLCCVQYASAFMHVEVVRDSIKKSLDFKEGYSVADMKAQKSAEPTGTYIHFMPDPKVFGEDIALRNNQINELLKEIQLTYPTLECTLTDERIN